MSNKTSDKNVGSIEEDVDELKSIMNLRTDSGFAYSQKNTLSLQKAIKNVLTDYTRQKQINEEHQKINGELREKVKELDTKNDELLKDLYSANCIIADLTDSIPKQKIKEKIEELKNEKEQLRIDKNVTWDSQIYKLDLKIQVLQKLLQESEDK